MIWQSLSSLCSRDSRPLWLSAHLIGLFSYRFLRKKVGGDKSKTTRHSGPTCHDTKDFVSPFKALIFPSRTTHTRMFPVQHSFSYSYFYVGIPVGWHGSINSILSADTSVNQAWFHVAAEDYLERGLPGLDLRQKLGHYLESQGLMIEDYPLAYLVTAPRFLGYAFNPVSFWYLYSSRCELVAMILEVNNTFDERRLYFLKMDEKANVGCTHEDIECPPSTTMQSGTSIESTRKRIRFSSTWSKDFHVSPFNSREGAYHLVAIDPHFNCKAENVSVSNTITLMSSQSHTKLIAKVFSVSTTIDPATCNMTAKMLLVLRYGLVGIITFPRILRQAWTLYFKLNLEVFFRPEVARSSIARAPTKLETEMASFFSRYLEYTIASLIEPLRLIYKPLFGMGPTCVFISKTYALQDDRTITIEVTSPVFYSRFVHYAHPLEAFDVEFLGTDAKNRTVDVVKPHLLTSLFKKGQESTTQIQDLKGLDKSRWAVMQLLRCRPASQAYNPTPDASNAKMKRGDIRRLPLSPLDVFVMSYCKDAAMYRRNATRLFLAQRYAFGVAEIVGLLEISLRVAVTILASWYCFNLRIFTMDHTYWILPISRIVSIGCIMNVCTWWALVKGF